jgi:uncharacterized membrane protein
MQDKMQKLTWQALIVTAGMGAIESFRALLLESKGLLPCWSSVCDAIRSDPIASPLGIPLAGWGLAYFCLVLILQCAAMFGRPQLATVGLVLQALGCLVSMSLVAYVLLRYGGTCRDCLTIAVLNLLALAMAAAQGEIKPAAPVRAALLTVVGLAMAVVLSPFLQLGQGSDVVDLGKLRSFTASQMQKSGVSIGNGGEVTIVFADFGCSSCRRRMAALLARPTTSLTVHIARSSDGPARAASILLLDAEPNEAPRVLSRLISEYDGNESSIDRLRKELGIGSSHGAARLAADLSLAETLRIRATPLVVRYENGEAHLAMAH